MTQSNENTRLEAFCDGVFAIALTLLIIEVRLPTPHAITTTAALWEALRHVLPIVFAFLLSFTVIFITWMNHRSALQLVRGSSPPFLYANGLLLLTVASIPFPTSLLGEYVLTDHGAPAVILYNAVLVIQAIAWLFFNHTALSGNLARSEAATATLREQRRNAYRAFALYGGLAVAAFWVPMVVALITTLSWVFWLMLSIRVPSDA